MKSYLAYKVPRKKKPQAYPNVISELLSEFGKRYKIHVNRVGRQGTLLCKEINIGDL